MHEESPSLGFDDSVILNPCDDSHTFPMCLLPSYFPEYYLDAPLDNPMICDPTIDLGYEDNMFHMLGGNVVDYVSLGYLGGYDPLIDYYYLCVGDLPRKVIWTTFLTPSHDFSIGFDKVKRVLIMFGAILVIASYLVLSKLWSQELDKLPRGLIASDLTSCVLKF